jgi:tungstate transport system ATP-binding protein
VSDRLYRLDRVVHAYAGRPVLWIDRLEIQAGEVVCLLGPTGAGKSTLLRLLAGLEAPVQGSIHLGKHPLGRRGTPLEVQRRLTLVWQRPLLLAGSVHDNTAYGLRLRGRRGPLPEVDEMLRRLGLDGLAARPAQGLSGGETQLVAVARALVLRPEVLLLDEPTANLDPARVALVEGVIDAVRRETGATVVWATHNLFQARRVAGRVALLLDGRVVETAGVAEFFASPRDPRTAAFVRGEMVY